MTSLAPDAALDVLDQFQRRLDAQFHDLQRSRAELDVSAPVFALEHGLTSVELDALKASVREAVRQGFGARYWRHTWLPFIVYAAESGYDYVGNEFWQSFEELTPGWAQFGSRDRIRTWFRKFTIEYGGALPKGAFAKSFPIIAWPITHAILPVYLQRYLAQLLFEFRMGLTTELLRSPEELGEQLAARAWGYTERFRIFCENTTLLGQVAAALLSGEDEDSPYLVQSTLRRLVAGLEGEREARFWLTRARQAASQVRARGLQPGAGRHSGAPSRERLPKPTDPRLALQKRDTGWQLFAQLPDLTGLSRRLPHLYEELRTKRARIDGAEQAMMARGRLVTTGQVIRLIRLPQPEVAFIELENGEAAINALIREQVEVSRGPLWLFKLRSPGAALDIKGRLVHPGDTYLVVHNGDWSPPDLNWADSVAVDIAGAEAVRLSLPDHLTEEESAALVEAGLSVVSDVLIRPVGFTASSWDGNGAVEWIAGEPGLIGIHAEQAPAGCTLALAGRRYTIAWPQEERELFLGLDDLPVGAHELRVILTDSQQQPLVEGSLQVVIRDPQARPEIAEAGEGIRLLASPARPTMSELWEEGAVAIVGPEGLSIDLMLTLRSATGDALASIPQPVVLPLLERDWVGVAKKVRNDNRFGKFFDQAEALELSVSRVGVGYAQLTADRGFQPLRWQVVRERELRHAHLIDRTDSGDTRVELFRVESPLSPEVCATGTEVEIPSNGGLLRAVAGDDIGAEATILLPTRPNELLGKQRSVPVVATGSRTLQEVMRLVSGYKRWAAAELPGDVFAQFQRDEVLKAITSSMVSLICGARWAGLEWRMARAPQLEDYLDEMKLAVGETAEHKEFARAIGLNLYDWLDPVALLTGFAEVAGRAIQSAGITNHPAAPRFLLTLAGRPGELLQWAQGERGVLLQHIFNSPVLLRAARFAVLGTRALKESGETHRGF